MGDVQNVSKEPDWHAEQQKTLSAWQELYMERGRVVVKIAQLEQPEPLEVDISDYSDEWCAGFIAGQQHAAALIQGVIG